MIELKPCPFCGSTENELIRFRQESKYDDIRYPDSVSTYKATCLIDKWYVKCKECKAQTDVFDTKIYQDYEGQVVIESNGAEKAIEQWNQRS